MDIEKAKEILGKEFNLTADFTNEVIQDLRLPKEARILDVGTGLGIMAIIIALNGYSVLTGEPEADDSEYAKQDWMGNAEKVNVNHLIEFKNFAAEKMPFENHTFDAVFMLGSLHHIDMHNRVKVLQECFRTSKSHAVICIFEPNQKGIKMIRQMNPAHPDAADPGEYAHELHSVVTKKTGPIFDAFIFHKF